MSPEGDLLILPVSPLLRVGVQKFWLPRVS